MQCKHSTSEKAKLPCYRQGFQQKIKCIRYNCDMESGSPFSTATSIPNNHVCRTLTIPKVTVTIRHLMSYVVEK